MSGTNARSNDRHRKTKAQLIEEIEELERRLGAGDAAETELGQPAEARSLLLEAIEHLAEGVALFDAEDHLVLCNRKYVSAFAPELEDGFEPGMGFEDLVRIATERNYYATDDHSTEDVIHQRLEAHRSRHARHEVRLADGSWVSFQSYTAPGGGTILLRLDITEKKEAAAALERAKEDTERLLLKVLPSQIVARMQQGEATIADRFDEATVLFSDLVGFTKLSARLSPKQLVDNLNDLFSRFDNLADRLGVEKVKTIGDAYVAVAGVPEARTDHVAAMAGMALGMIEAVAEFNAVLDPKFQLRVGLQTGPVAAGIIGKHRFLYDIWGDTMNMASRFESYSEPGRIHVSAEVARILDPDFDLESRGIMNIRGKGAVPTYFLNGRK